MKLTPRLQCIAQMMPPCSCVADIGTDHGKLPVYLVENGTAQRAIACDVRPGPVRACQATVKRHGMEDRIAVRLGDGLAPLSQGEADCAVLAGMGGELIARILRDAERLAKSMKALFVQPMTSVEELRKEAFHLGYRIERERLAREEEKLYLVLQLAPGTPPSCSEYDFWISPALLESADPLLELWLRRERSKLDKQLDGLRHAAVLQYGQIERLEKRRIWLEGLL